MPKLRDGRGKLRPCGPRLRIGRFSSQHLVCWPGWRFDAEGDLIGDGDAIALEGDNFFRMIGEDANVLEAEVDQDLRADTALVLDHALARGLAVELAALMEMNLGKRSGIDGGIDGEAAAGVMEVKEHAPI